MITKNVNVPADTWTEVSSLKCSVSNPKRNSGDIYVAQNATAPSANLLGHRLEGSQIYNADGTANKVWVKSTKAVVVAVTEG